MDAQVPAEPPEAVAGSVQLFTVVAAQDAGAAWLAEQDAAEPPFVPEQVQETELPAEGNAVVDGLPEEHCVYGLYEDEPYGYVLPLAEPQAPLTAQPAFDGVVAEQLPLH